ncbi:MAG: hypothetical protein BWY76_00411 [bacterium ADurb.Bin429]|nr:MAG: hypothetical protein BWY76_00411 [bacterium ADurb.Bin429]
MSTRRTSWLLFTKAYLMAGILLLLSLPQESTANGSTTAQEPQWKVTSVSAAPDGRRAAVHFTDNTPSEYERNLYTRHAVAIFDLDSGKRLSPTSPANSRYLPPGPVAWSHDGACFAYIGRDHIADSDELFVIGRDGIRRPVPNTRDVRDFLWSPETADTILYVRYEEHVDTVSAYHVPSGQTKRMLWGGDYLQLFTVRNKACVSDRRGATILAVTSKKRILTIPYSGFYAKTDGAFFLEMSPDGKYVAMCLGASGWTCAFIFHASDAGSIFRKEHLAIYWQEDHSFLRLSWPLSLPPYPIPVRESFSREVQEALDIQRSREIVNGYIFADGDAIHKQTGSRGGMLTCFANWQCVEWWSTRDKFLLVTDHGLYASSLDGSNLYDADSKDLLPPLIPHPLPESALFPN